MDVFAANAIEAFDIESGTPAEMTGRTNATYSTKGIVTQAASLISKPFIDPTTGAAVTLTSGWFHCAYFSGGPGDIIELVNSTGVAVIRIFEAAQNSYQIQAWSGSAWIATAATFNLGTNRECAIDVNFNCTAGTVDLYIDNTLRSSLAGLSSAVLGSIAKFRLLSSSFVCYQFVVSDASTIGAFVASLNLNANSATNTAWVNDFNSVWKTGINDATFISSGTLGDNETYGAADIALPSSQYVISSMWFALRAKLNSATPANIKPLLRIGGVNYAGAYNFANLSAVTFANSIAAYANDPSTSSAWGLANLNLAEIGVQTAA
jgi:hypothetical protein